MNSKKPPLELTRATNKLMREEDQEEFAKRRIMSRQAREKSSARTIRQKKGQPARSGREKEKKLGRYKAFQAACFRWQEERHATPRREEEKVMLSLLDMF